MSMIELAIILGAAVAAVVGCWFIWSKGHEAGQRAEHWIQPAVTPEMKARLIGEFHCTVERRCAECDSEGSTPSCDECDGEVAYTEKVTIPWTTQKEIFSAMWWASRNG